MSDTNIANAAFYKWPETKQLLMHLDGAGIDARFVGGCVRDAILGREASDVDLASATPPEDVMHSLRKLDVKVLPTGIEHGTVTIIIGDKQFELTTLRRDVSCDGRHAVVAYTNEWPEDAARRDFTINALYADKDGGVYDYHDGLKDLRTRQLRFIGDAEKRIKEDALRILRLFRFQAQLGFDVEVELYELCKKKVKLLKPISAERISSETMKLLKAPKPTQAWEALFDYGIASKLYDGLLGRNISVVLEAERQLCGKPFSANERLILLAWLAEEHDAEELKAMLALSNAHTKYMERVLTYTPHMKANMSINEQRRLHYILGSDVYRLCIAAASASDLAGHLQRSQAGFIRMMQDATDWTPPNFEVKGEDLIALGHTPGEAMGKTLRELENKWIDSGFEMEKDALLNSI